MILTICLSDPMKEFKLLKVSVQTDEVNTSFLMLEKNAEKYAKKLLKEHMRKLGYPKYSRSAFVKVNFEQTEKTIWK